MGAFARQESIGRRDHTPGSALASGEVIVTTDGIAAVAAAAIAANGKGTIYTMGIFDVDSESATTFTVGDPVHIDISTGYAVNPGSGGAGDVFFGIALVAKVATELKVRCELNPPGAGAGGAGSQRALMSSRVPLLDHGDATENYLVDAAANPNGMVIIGTLAEVVEAPVGDQEDQMIVTIYDSDDNALCTLTTTNTTPDAIGDVVIGTLSLWAASTGAVLPIIPADKGCYAKVTQTTDDATPTNEAGALRVRVILAPQI